MGRYDYWRDQDFLCWGGGDTTTGVIKTSSARSRQRGNTTTGVIKTSCVGGGQWGDMTTGIANRRLLLEGVLWGDNGTVERGSSVVECRTRNQVSPDSNPPLLPFRRLGIFVLSIESIWL